MKSAPVLYANCDAARAAGAAPIYAGQPGYRRALDRYNDGIACDSGSPSTMSAQQPSRTLSSALTLASIGQTAPRARGLVTPIEGIAQVLDGDTIQIGTTRIRIYGIDAFEAEQLCKKGDGETYGCGGRSTRALSEDIEGKFVTCIPDGRDAYDRMLARCRHKSMDIGAWMVRQGHALAYTKYALDYVNDEKEAKRDQEGAWGGTFELPWEFRLARPAGAAEAQRSATAPSANCVIKGNVNRESESIYHLPADPYYVRVKPENWFCAVDEAERAGFRRAGSN